MCRRLCCFAVVLLCHLCWFTWAGINTITLRWLLQLWVFSMEKTHYVAKHKRSNKMCTYPKHLTGNAELLALYVLNMLKIERNARRLEIKWKNQAFHFSWAQLFRRIGKRICYYPRKCRQRQMNWFTVDGNRNPNRQINTQMHRNYIFKWIDFEPRFFVRTQTPGAHTHKCARARTHKHKSTAEKLWKTETFKSHNRIIIS